MSKIEVNTVEPQCGTTLTLGGSGDTVTLGSGASQSGFGRTGTVDWQTGDIKTGDFTAANGKGYFVDTTSGAITVTLPSSPTAGDIVAVKDYAKTFDQNTCTLARNGSKIEGASSDSVLGTEGLALTIVFVDSTQGWVATDQAESQDAAGAKFVAATGGTITTVCTNFKVHTFTGPGTFTVTCAGNPQGSNTVDYLVIGGGGGGGSGNGGGGGGGAGGYRESSGTATGGYTIGLPANDCVAALPVTAQGYPITVDGGGAGGPKCGPGGGAGTSGGNSTFSTITAHGGGGAGGGAPTSPTRTGLNGGSGGGSAKGPASGGSGNTPPVSPSQGNSGGGSTASPPVNDGGGGGGAGDQGETVTWNNNRGGNGGIGATSHITGSPVGRGGGGGANSEVGGVGGTGGVHSTGGTPQPSAGPSSPRTPGFGGGLGHGGNGCSPNNATAGTANTGGGGGGIDVPAPYAAPNGGSGVVIIRYKFQ